MQTQLSQNIKLGVLLALLASLCSTIMSVFVKLIGSDQSTAVVLFSRFFIGLILLFPWMLTDKKLFKVDNKTKVLLRCVTSILAMGCVFYSLKFMPVANVLLLNNTFPLFLPLLSWVMLSIKTPAQMWIGIILGFIGVAIVLHPSASAFNWHAGIALLSGILAALAMLQIRLLANSSTTQQILFYLFAFGTITTIPFVSFSSHMPNYHDLWLLFFVGLFGAGYQFFLTLALNYAKARIVSPIYFSCIIFAGILDWFIWSVKFNFLEIVGMGLILIGGILTVVLADKNQV